LETYADDDDDNVGADPMDVILAKLDDEIQQKEASKKTVEDRAGSSVVVLSDRKIIPLVRENPSGTQPPPNIDLSEIDEEDDGNSTEKM
jgi:division protein CdvB (Snf7/Vps24/ESCRT-III family)